MSGAPAAAEAPAPQQDFSDSNYNNWSGYEGALFANTAYDNEDREADDILETVDKYLDGRRSEKRKKIMTEQLEEVENAAPKYQEQFADLKRQLANVSKEEWESIPDNPYLGGKRVKAQRYTPTPDNLMDGARLDGESINFIDPESADSSNMANSIAQTPMTNLSELGEARVLNLGLKLDKMSNSVMGTSVVNKSGYLTDLNAIKLNSASEINDIK